MERKIIEKNRRNMMKNLCSKLVSLIPPDHFNPPKESLSLQDQIGQATDYIGKLSARIDELKEAKAKALGIATNTISINNDTTRKLEPPSTSTLELLPVLRVRDLGSSLEIVLISGLEKKIMVHQVIRLLEEEGTEVVMSSLAYVGNKIVHTLHAQVKVARIGVDTSKLCARLEELIC